jgi:hypothetical protein
MSPVEALAGSETVEIITALHIIGALEGQSPDGTSVHIVVVFLVCLGVLSVFEFAMRLVVDVFPSHNGPWADCWGSPMLVWECVEPKNAQKYHFDNQLGRVALKTSALVRASGTLLDSANASFYLRHVFILTGNVESSFHVCGYRPMKAFKFEVSMNVGHSKASLKICAVNLWETVHECLLLSVRNSLGSNEKMDMKKPTLLTNILSIQRATPRYLAMMPIGRPSIRA